MFTPEQKRFVYENSVKVNDQNKYIEVMGHFANYFAKEKQNSLKRKIGFVFFLLIITYIAAQSLLFNLVEVKIMIFRASAIFVGVLLGLKLGFALLNHIDHMPIINKIKNKECDMLCYEGDLNDVSKFINYKSTSSAMYNYFVVISGSKYEIDRGLYKGLLQHKGKRVKVYYFAELLTRQMLISDSSVFMVEE